MSRIKKLLLVLVSAFGVSSAIETRLSVFAVLCLVIGLAALAREKSGEKAPFRALLLFGLLAATVGMARFVWQEALPGIAEARGRATSKKAVSILREILFAQDAMRRYAAIDPDADAIGSAGTLSELSGGPSARYREGKMASAPLAARFSPRTATRTGPASELDGYLFLVCVPGRDAPFVTHPSDPVDEERAERRWLAYAWPVMADLGHTRAFFIDEHERILESENLLPARGAQRPELRLLGTDRAPSCTDALDEATRSAWHPWQGKQARKSLPGDH